MGMQKIRKSKVSIVCLLLVWFPVLLFSFSDPDQEVKELEEKLKTASDKEKIELYNDFAKKHTRTVPGKSMDYANKALALCKEANHKKGEAAALTNIANIYTEQKNYPRALKYLREANSIYNEIGSHWWVANSIMGIGNLYTRMGQYEKARVYLESALGKAKEIKAGTLIQTIYKNLSHMYETRGDFKEAREYHGRFSETKDNLYKKKNSQEVALMQAKYETQKKENELHLLRKTRESQHMVRIFLVIAVLLSLGLVVVLFSQYRTKKRANQLLHLGEAKYRALFSQAGGAIFLVDDGSIVDCNEIALEIFGATREEIIGHTFARFSLLTQPDKRDSFEVRTERINKALNGDPQRFYRQYVKKDGSPIETMVSLSAVTINNKRLIQAIVHDISDQRQLEEEQVKSAKLETTTLIAGGFAHDFNNLLTVIMGNLELTSKETGSDDKIKPLLTQLEKSINSAVGLSEKFFTLSKSESHTGEILSIGATLREAVQFAQGDAETPVRCNFQVPADLWPFYGDVNHIKRVIELLTRNALNAMGPNGEMEVKAANVELKEDEVPPLPTGRYVVISMKDNGEGIPGKNLDKIFDPYFSTLEEYSRKGLGTGLTIAQAIIKRHNGTITVSSQVGTGTTFHIYLPATGNQ
jgi:PAS domain S-box-containing protein